MKSSKLMNYMWIFTQYQLLLMLWLLLTELQRTTGTMRLRKCCSCSQLVTTTKYWEEIKSSEVCFPQFLSCTNHFQGISLDPSRVGWVYSKHIFINVNSTFKVGYNLCKVELNRDREIFAGMHNRMLS